MRVWESRFAAEDAIDDVVVRLDVVDEGISESSDGVREEPASVLKGILSFAAVSDAV